MKKRFLKLWSVLLSICMLSAHIAAMATETANGGLSLEILSVQKLADPYDSAAPDMEEARGGDAVALTVGLRNAAGESVSLTGVAFSLEYDGDYLEVENLDLEKNADLGWNLTAERPENSQTISVTGTGAAYEMTTGADASVFVTRFAFRVLQEAQAGTAEFTLSSAAVYDADENRVEISVKNRSLRILEAETPKQTITAVTLPSEGVTIDGTSAIAPIQAVASDADETPITENLVWSISPVGKGAEIDPQSGMITLESTAAGEYTVTAKAAENQETLTGEASAKLTVTNDTVVIVTFDPTGGTVDAPSVTIERDGTISEFPTPTREGYDFQGWFTSADGGEEVTNSTTFTTDTTIFAHWEENAAADKIVITLNPNGGVISVSSIMAIPGEPVTLPVPTSEEDDTFVGWFTEPDGGQEVSSPATFTANTTLFAHWQRKISPTPGGGGSGGGGTNVSPGGSSGGGSSSSGSAKSYSITVTTATNGKITAPTSAKNNSTVAVTVTPDSGYRLKSLSVVKQNGGSVTVKESKGKYTFIMPPTNVTVSATFQTAKTESGGVPQQQDEEKNAGASVGNSPFSDVSVSALLYNDIKWANEKGLMMGYADGTYLPNKAVSSITAVVVLARMTDSSLKNATSGLWYRNYQTWATQNNILPSGIRMQDTQFSRGEMARLMVSYLKFKGKDCTPPAQRVQFTDANRMLPGEEDAFQYLYSKNVFEGTSALTMSPRGHVTRAQFAALIHRLSYV